MQTFLPYEDFHLSAKCLDRQRLGKQRVETLQIMQCLIEGKKGWQNHPAVRMWKGYENALGMYGIAICKEWVHRGYQDSCTEKIEALLRKNRDTIFLTPHWLGDEDLHRSHQSNLVRKLPEHYREFFPEVQDDLPYIWPNRA